MNELHTRISKTINDDGNGLEICRHLKETQTDPQSYILLLSGIKTTSDYQTEGLEADAAISSVRDLKSGVAGPRAGHASFETGGRSVEGIL